MLSFLHLILLSSMILFVLFPCFISMVLLTSLHGISSIRLLRLLSNFNFNPPRRLRRQKGYYMKNFLWTVAASVFPSLLRLIAAAIEGYFEGIYGDKDGGENE